MAGDRIDQQHILLGRAGPDIVDDERPCPDAGNLSETKPTYGGRLPGSTQVTISPAR